MGKLKRFVEGMKALTPLQLARSEMIGYVGTMIGTIFAWVWLAKMGLWYLHIALAFAVFLQCVQLIGSFQKYSNLQEMEKEEIIRMLKRVE